MKVNVAINGFGRIGRLVFRACYEQEKFQIVAINDLTKAKTLAHLLKYDSAHGRFPGEVSYGDDYLSVNGRKIDVTSIKEISELKWQKYRKPGELLVVVEATGVFRDPKIVKTHVDNGAEKVIITAPTKKNDPDAIIVMGVNEDDCKTGYKKHHKILSNASCTTNCLAPIIKILHDKYGIVRGLMTTIHSYTNDQRILDLEHKDLRRARTAGVSQIPTTTGAAKAIGKVIPDLFGKFDGFAIRVPTANVSVVDVVVETIEHAELDEIKKTLKEAAASERWSRYLAYSEEPLVSIDYNHDSRSAIVDAEFMKVIPNSNMVKILAWYDNEWGYSNRIVDLIQYIAEQEA